MINTLTAPTGAIAPVRHFVPPPPRVTVRAQDALAQARASAPITVAFVEPNRVVGEGLVAILNATADLRTVAATAADLALLAETKPRVLVLAVGHHAAESLAAAAGLKHAVPDSEIVAINFSRVDESVPDFVRVGVSGFVLKEAGVAELLETIRAVARGAQVLPPPMTDVLFAHIRHTIDEHEHHRALNSARMTPREHLVIELIGEGLSNKEIAQRLNIATHTVKTHVRHVMEKLTLHTRLQVAAFAHTGVVTLHSESVHN